MIPVTKPFLPSFLPKEEYDAYEQGIWQRNISNGPLVNGVSPLGKKCW